ncbi:MAG: phosphatase PAP2 family protein [Longicatena sp.]
MIKNTMKWIKEHPHCRLLGYWIFYLIYFFLLERIVVAKYILYSPIDAHIPFLEIFIIPYALWFPLLAVSQGYYMLKDRKEFQNLCFFMFTGMSICLLIYTILPNGLDLRVDHYPDNVFANIVSMLQGFDSPTNVCPSIHVSTTLAIHLSVLRYKNFKHPLLLKGSTSILSILIILSTMFLKQHSIIDVVAGILLTLVLYPITYHTNWKKLFQHTFIRKYLN